MLDNQVKVLQIVAAPTRQRGNRIGVNGPERRSLNLLPHWSKKSVKPYILYPQRGRLWNDFRSFDENVKNFEIVNKWFWHKAIPLRNFVLENKIDIIHTQGPASLDFIAAITSIISGVPLVVTRPVLITDMFKPRSLRAIVYNLIDKVTTTIASRIVAVSADGADRLKKECSVPQKKIIIIRNGTDLGRFLCINRSFNQTEKITVGMVAQLTDQKRWQDFISTIKAISDRCFPIKGLIIGDGPLREELKHKIEAQGLSKTITMRGFCDSVERELSQMDIFLFASNWEGLPMAVVEAMAAGLPIVATDIAALKELVQDGKNGFLCPIGDVEAMANSCEKIIRSNDLRAEMGDTSRKIAAELFSEARMLEEYSFTYHQIKLETKSNE